MLNLINEGYTLNVITEDAVTRVIFSNKKDIMVFERSLISILLSGYDNINSYIKRLYNFKLIKKENYYEAMIYRIIISDDDDIKIKPLVVSKHPQLEYALYILDYELKRRDKTKSNLTLIKRKC